jgi:TolB-like protein
MKKALAVWVVLSGVAHAATPAVAVMPFKDLSGKKASIGEAIRETVTTDLKDISGLRVIERGNIDKILAEQNLQAKRDDLDATSTVKVGKLLGASLIVTGAYQEAKPNVRLTARFVKVETGEIVGTAKVDGSTTDFLKLQDKVTAQLLKSAGIGESHVQKFAARPRPKLKTWKTVELYGDAVVEKDDGKKRELLLAALNEDPSFVYAKSDLDELEKRLKSYDVNYRRETDKEVRELLAKAKDEKDAMKLYMLYNSVTTKLVTQRRWGAVMQLCKEVEKNPPPKPDTPGILSTAETCGYYVVNAYQSMNNCDGLLREGEKFISKNPTSMYFSAVRMQMDQCINKKRTADEGKPKAASEIAALSDEQKKDPCRVAEVYKSNAQLKDAVTWFEKCRVNPVNKILPVSFTLIQLITTTHEMGDFRAMRKYYEELMKVAPDQARNMRPMVDLAPADL